MISWGRGKYSLTGQGFTMRTLSAGILLTLLLLTAPLASAQQVDSSLLKKPSEVADGKTMDQWMNDLKDKDPSVRETAIHMLKVYGKDARVATRDIIRAMQDTDDSLRVNAAITLGFIGLDPQDTPTLQAGVNMLIRLMDDRQGIVRFQAAMALSRLGPDASAAIPRLVSLIKDSSSWEIRRAAANALGSLGMIPGKGIETRAFSALLYGVNDLGAPSGRHSIEVRVESLVGLITLGTPGDLRFKREEINTITPLTGPKQPKRVSIWARVVLMRIDDQISEQHLGFIGKCLSDSDFPTRSAAARALATIGKGAKSQVRPLIDALDGKKEEPEVLVFSCNALGSMGGAAQEAAPALKLLKNHTNEAVRKAATDALEKLDTKAANP
jgi:HEAT repeat protein